MKVVMLTQCHVSSPAELLFKFEIKIASSRQIIYSGTDSGLHWDAKTGSNGCHRNGRNVGTRNYVGSSQVPSFHETVCKVSDSIEFESGMLQLWYKNAVDSTCGFNLLLGLDI
jgi:hypothetical protein